MKSNKLKTLHYLGKKAWFRSVFPEDDWITKTGESILTQARGLGYSIGTATFYKIRREILKEIGHSDPDPDPFPRFLFEKLTRPEKVSIEEMVDQAIESIRG